MDYTCFRCGDPGHISAECPTRGNGAHPPAQAAGAAAPLPEAGLLASTCPLCGVLPGKTCVNITTNEPMYRNGTPVTHPARHEAIWHDPHMAAHRAELRALYSGL